MHENHGDDGPSKANPDTSMQVVWKHHEEHWGEEDREASETGCKDREIRTPPLGTAARTDHFFSVREPASETGGQTDMARC
jgi:hypothetical protein